MPKITSTSSSSSDRITDCAPVSWCGATFLGALPADLGAGFPAGTGFPVVDATGSGARVVGALTVSSIFGARRVFCWRARKHPRQLLLHEGCALVLVGVSPTGLDGTNAPTNYYQGAQVGLHSSRR